MQHKWLNLPVTSCIRNICCNYFCSVYFSMWSIWGKLYVTNQVLISEVAVINYCPDYRWLIFLGAKYISGF